MSLSKAVPEGLKSVECERGVGGKNSPIRYIPEQDPIQEALETKHQPTSFKLSLPSGSEMRMVRWASGTPEHFLIHVRGAIHAIKEMELDTKFQEAMKAVESASLEVDLTKMQYKDELKKRERDDSSQQVAGAGKAASDKTKKSRRTEGEDSPPAEVVAAKAALEVARKARNEAQERADMLGAQIFQLYGNLLTDEARQPWEKIVKAQTDTIPREDLRGEVHEEKAGKTWTSFLECVTFHLQSVFRPDAAEAVKFYITNTLKKPNRVPIRQFFVRVEQLNSYLENLPSLFQSPKANSATKPVTPLEDADLATHLLRMCPVKWQRQYDLMENSTPVSTRALLMVLENIESNVELDDKPPSKDKAKGADSKRKAESNDSRNPKKAKKGWTEKHCSLCKKHGGAHTTHNTKECRRYNKDGSHKKAGGMPKPNKPASGKDGMNFAQLIRTKTKKAVRSALKKVNRGKKRRSRHEESDSDSDSDY